MNTQTIARIASATAYTVTTGLSLVLVLAATFALNYVTAHTSLHQPTHVATVAAEVPANPCDGVDVTNLSDAQIADFTQAGYVGSTTDHAEKLYPSWCLS